VSTGPGLVRVVAGSPLQRSLQSGVTPQSLLPHLVACRRLGNAQVNLARVGLLVNPITQSAPLTNQTLVRDINLEITPGLTLTEHQEGPILFLETLDNGQNLFAV